MPKVPADLTPTRQEYLDLLPTISDEVYETEHHLHNRERWAGKAASQTATDWATPTRLTPFVAVSGNGDFGQDTNDEALVFGTDDTPVISGMTRFDLHRLEVESADNANEWVVRVIYGTGTMAAAEGADQYTDVMVMEARKGSPISIINVRGTCGVTKVWARVKSATNDDEISFYVGWHEYER